MLPTGAPVNPQTRQAASIDTPTQAFALQHRECEPCHDLMGGTETMRAAGKRYLPQRTAEEPETWQARVADAVLENIFAQTVRYNRGQVFARNVVLDNTGGVLNDEALAAFQAWAENCDRCGNNLTSWGGDTFAQGLVDGVVFTFIDYPAIAMRQNGAGLTEYQDADGAWRPRTLAAERAEGWQPYLVRIEASQVLDCRADWVRGRRVVTHFRYREDSMEPDPANPWGERAVSYIRAYWPDRWEQWQKIEGETDYRLVQQGRLTVPEIPLAVFVAGAKRSDFTARPALMDLAWLNIRHWQTTSGHYNLMGFCQNPVWALVGVMRSIDAEGKEEKIPFSPGHVLYLPDNGDVRSVGVDASAVAASREELQRLKEDMAAYGLQLLRGQVGNITATEVERNSRENNSQLKNWALDFQDFLENCLYHVAQWWGLPDGPSVKLNDDFHSDVSQVEYLLQLHDKALLSRETLFVMLQRLGLVPDDVAWEDELDKLGQDTANSAGAEISGRLSRVLQQAPQGAATGTAPASLPGSRA